VPPLAQQFIANATTTTPNGAISSINIWMWDTPARRARQEVYVNLFGALRRILVNIFRYDLNQLTNAAFAFDNPAGCTLGPLNEDQKSWQLNSMYQNVSRTSLKGVPVDLYSYTGSLGKWSAYITISSPIVVRREMLEKGGQVEITDYDYSKFGPVPDNFFVPDPSWGCE